MSIEQAVLENLKTLPIEKQQEVLDFVKFLQSKEHKREYQPTTESPGSFLTATQEFAGCLDGGPTDLSSNKKYLEGLGTE